MPKKKILFIIESYPSENSANVLCDEKIIKDLIETNLYEIHVLCYRYNFQPKYEIINEVVIHRFSKGLWWNVYTWARHQKSSWKTRIIFLIDRFILRFKQFITIPIYPHTNWVISWLGYIYAIKLQKKHNFDIVITEHNALSTTITGYLLKKRFFQIKFMPIFWDALSVGIPVKYLPLWFSQSKRINLEKKIFKIADLVIVMQGHEKKLKELYFNTDLWKKIKVLDNPSFMNREKNIQETNIKNNIIKICFAGSVANRNIEYLGNVFEQTKLNLELLIITQEFYRTRINKLIKKCSNIQIQFIPYMPHEELLKLFEEVNVFINLGVDSNTMVASKIFEYMSFGKPIISTYRRSDDANVPYFKKYPLSFLLDEREKDISKQATALQKFIEENINKKVGYEEIAPLFYKNTPQAYVEEIDKLLKEE